MSTQSPAPNPRRRPAAGGARPRKLAGHGSAPRPEADTPSEPEAVTTPQRSRPVAPPTPPAPLAPPTTTPVPDGVLTRSRTTVILAGVLAALLVAAAVLGWQLKDEDDASKGTASPWMYEPGEAFEVPKKPIAVDFVKWRGAVDASAKAVTDILSVTWKTYDEHLAAVVKMMSDDFAADYRKTAEASRDKFLESEATYQVEVVNQAVISATPSEVKSLIFLNQYVTKGTGKAQTGPDVYQVRVITTAVADGDGWRIASLDPF